MPGHARCAHRRVEPACNSRRQGPQWALHSAAHAPAHVALTCLQPHQACACAQAVWVASLAVAVPVVARAPWMAIPSAHVEILAGAAAVGSVCAELFMIKSLLVFEPKASTVPSGTLGVISGDRAGNVAMSGPRMNPTMAVGECQVNCDTLVS